MAGETFQLRFRNNEDVYLSIDEPINFATVDFQLSQKDKGYGRDVSFNGGEVQFEFVKYRNHYLDKLLSYNNTYGFESIVELIITCGTVTTIIGELDFATAVTDDLEYFKCKVIQQSSKQIVKRRKAVKVDLLSDKDIDGNSIPPLVPQNILLISKPIYQISKWEQPADAARYYSTFNIGTRTWGLNFSRQITESNIADTLVPTESRRVNLDSNAYNGLQCITASTNLKNIKISIPAFYFYVRINGINSYNPSGYLSYSFNYGITDSPSDNYPTINRFINTVTLNTEGAFYTYNQSFEATIPSLSAGQSLFIWHEITTYNQTAYNFVNASVTCKGMDVNISAESDTFNSIAPSFRLVDVMRQVVKSISGLNISAPRFEVGQDFYDNRLANGNSLRAISNKPFYVSLEDLEKSLVELNVDWEINASGNIFFGTEDDFYTESIAYTFNNTQFSSFNKSFNPRFSINEFNYGYKNFQSLKENEEPNSADVIHGESKWVLNNKMVENKKEISIEWTRDSFLIETNRRKSLEVQPDTSSQNDDTLFVIDTVNTASDVTYSEKISLLHSYNSTDAILTLTNTGELNFLVIGITIGSSFQIVSPTAYNIGTYIVVLSTSKILELKLLTSGTPVGQINPFLTYFNYTLKVSTIPYTNYTNSGFTNITNLIGSDKYSNLRYSTRRNIEKYWKKYLATCNLYHKTQGLLTTWYKNNADFSSTYSGLTLTEREVIDTYAVNPILTPFIYNDVIFSNVEFSDFITLQDNIRTNRGYIKTKDNNGNDLKLYPTTMKYDNLSKELNIKGEEKYTPTTLVQIAPIITTKSISNISGSTATSGGYIKTNGGSAITSKGVVWSLATNPTIALTTKTNDGIGSVDYSSLITGLYPSTKYYVKSYATNAITTSYGNEVNFTVDYNKAIIGNQTWADSNLNVSTYRDGTVIPQVTDPTAWASLTTGAWCYYDNNSNNQIPYAKLYNWYAIYGIYDSASLADPLLRKNIAPDGWRIPSSTDFNNLSSFLGGSSVAGTALKLEGWDYWYQADPTYSGTNSSNFSAVGGGQRQANGDFVNIKAISAYWCKDISSTNVKRLRFENGVVENIGYSNANGFSVRLIKD